ncbi:MAG: hypothetical protein HXY41_15825 [Chloroflexi bacterium]|nr:hypothetical protein [Chloroflexota bacterium]
MRVVLLAAVLLAGCSGGAVVFAPTPPPPDTSPLVYQHPGGAFSIMIPRRWAVSVQHTTTLAAAAFSPPGADEPAVRLAVVNLGKTVESAALGEFINRYQTELRPQAGGYVQASRQAMGDGSWRLSGLQHTPGGHTQPVNTFIQASGSLVAVIEVAIPDDAARLKELQLLVNTFELRPDVELQPVEPSAALFASAYRLDFLNVAAWTTPAGAFIINGEVANAGPDGLAAVPLRAVLRSADGLVVAETADVVMGYGIPAGGFAPFSLRFGQGQPALAKTYELVIGGEGWVPETLATVYGPETLEWTDESSLDAAGQLIITGRVSNSGGEVVRGLRAVVTVFAADQRVIAAGYGDITPSLAPGEATAFQITLPELGGEPLNYILNIQGLP